MRTLVFIALLVFVTHALGQGLERGSDSQGANHTYYTGTLNLSSCLRLAGSNGTCVMTTGYTETIPAGNDGPTIWTAGTKLIGQPGSRIIGAAGRTALLVRGAGDVVDGVTISLPGGGSGMIVGGGAAFTGTTVRGSAVIKSPSSTRGLLVGETVAGPGIPVGAIVIRLNPLTVSANASQSTSGVPLFATSDDITVRNSTINGADSYSINAGSGSNITFDNNTIVTASTGGASGIFWKDYDSPTTGTRVRHNRITINAKGEGILLHSDIAHNVANEIDIEDNIIHINSSTACFGIEVGSFGATIPPTGGKITGNTTILGANGACGGISLNNQWGLTVQGNMLDANGHTYSIEAVELAQGSDHNVVVDNHVINAPSMNTGGLFDLNGSSYNKVIGNDGNNVASIYIGYTGPLDSSNNLVEGNTIGLSAAVNTRAALWIQCQASTSNHCDNNVIRNNSLTTNASTKQCLTVEADVPRSTVANTVFEGNKCNGFTGSWYLYTNFNNGSSVSGTDLHNNVGPGAIEINDRANSVIRANDVGFRSFTKPGSQSH